MMRTTSGVEAVRREAELTPLNGGSRWAEGRLVDGKPEASGC